MACRNTRGYQQICRLRPLRQHHTIRDFIRLHRHFNATLVFDLPGGRGKALYVIRIAVVRTHADRIVLDQVRLYILLPQHEIAGHSTALANV